MGQQRMVVLANSKKPGGYCMAGKVLDAEGHVGGWIRPVVSTAAQGLPYDRTVCGDGRKTDVLDVVAPQWGTPVPQLHQRENCLLGPSALQRCGRASWGDLPALSDSHRRCLWLDGFSSNSGSNDRIPQALLGSLPDSLRLLQVPELRLVRVAGYAGKMKNRAMFSVGGARYNLALTDMVAIGWLDLTSQLTLDAYVCVSLAVPLGDGYAYKVAAAVITEERAEGRA
jgi:hypothetical protein